jgi:ankyrin repeat protein
MCSLKGRTGCKSLALWTFTTISHLLCRFRWVYCQIVYLRLCLPGCIRHALDELPETLDETYERALRNINKANWRFAYRLLQYVAVAFRPLRVTELAEILSFDFKTDAIPKFHEDWRVEDSVEAVLSTTSSLLAKVDVWSSPVIQFSHFSVKEYLTSSRLAETDDIISHRYHISMTSAHTLAAQTCLGILLHLDKSVIRQNKLNEYPLAEYAAEYWVNHARLEGVSGNVEDGMKRLFDPRKEHLAIWVRIHDPMWPAWDQIRQTAPHSLRYTSRANPPPMSLEPKGSPLHYAALCGLQVVVKFLIIQHSQDVHSRCLYDELPLHLASRQGHADVALVLLEHGADLTAKTNDGSTPLHLTKSVNVTRLLLEHGADATAQTKDGSRPLHAAVQKGYEDCARLLLEHGADVTAQTKNGSTPLHQARYVEIARLLLEHGADATAQTKYGSTPLHAAVQKGYEDCARLLLEHGADATAQTKHGWTPLHAACDVKVARLLLEHGADATAQTKHGSTPFHRTWKVEVARFLLEHGADATAQTKDGSTPLHLAVRFGHANPVGYAAVIHFLLESGGDVTVQRKDGSTLLHLASRWGHAEVARCLFEHGADMTALNKHGWSALHLASRWGHVEVARFLLDQGADVTGENNYGSTPLRLALRAGHAEVACLLVERGADATSMDEEVATPLEVVLHQEDLELVLMPERESMQQPESIRQPRTGTVVFVVLVVAWGIWLFSRYYWVCVQICVHKRTGNLTRSYSLHRRHRYACIVVTK